MRGYAPFVFGLSILLMSPGCATIVQGRYQDLTINSTPPGAAFEVDGISGTTPATVSVRRKVRQHVVTISKPGYETAQISVGRETNAWLAGNILWGLLGLPGLGIDFISGSAYELTSNTVSVEMHQDSALAERSPAHSAAPGTSRVLEVQHVQPPPTNKPPDTR
jgi:hypothetical protein